MAGDGKIVERQSRPIGRLQYLAASLPLLVIEYAAAFFPASNPQAGQGASVIQLGWIARLGWVDGSLFGLVILLCTAALGWLSFRRASTTGQPERMVALAVIPWLQLPAILWLAISRATRTPPARQSFAGIRGALWGLGIAFGAEIVATLAFGSYGVALFVGAPFVVGLVASYLAERDGHPRPLIVAQYALLLASTVLFGFALEGVVCLAMAYPLAAFAALIGGGCGLALAQSRAPRETVFSSVALLPILLMVELASPPIAHFADAQSVEIKAPPGAVWTAIVHMGTIRTAPAAPFGWGLAYPVAGHINGEGVGAVRLGIFSTGKAYERVTRWEPGHELWFDVLSDPPMMHETNPFGVVNAPHLEGYFSTRDARFTLTALPGGRTQLTLATDHTLRIGPTAYFLPLAHWAVHDNKLRVLAHFRDRAERSVQAMDGVAQVVR